MKKIKSILLGCAIVTGSILGTISGTFTDVQAWSGERKICRHCTGTCMTATFENECGTCNKVKELCTAIL